MTLEEARNIVFEKKKEFAKLYKEFGDMTWLQYAKAKFPTSPTLSHTDELFSALRTLLVPLIGETKTNRAEESIKATGFVSTCDHHGILHHPFFSNASLVRSHPDIAVPSTVCFTCGCVSPSNSSYPRGISFEDDDHKVEKLSFISLRYRRRPLFGLPAFSRETFYKNKDRVHLFNLNKDKKQKLITLFENIEHNTKIFTLARVSDQFTMINDILWEELFSETRGNLVYLEVESLVRQLLLDVHLDHDTLVHKIIFDHGVRASYLENFEMITGAHNSELDSGSEIFWFIDEIKNTRVALRIKDNTLISKDGSIEIPLYKDVIRDHLIRFELMPSMAFCYSILSFYYGLTLGGGFSQIDYLGDMKNAWAKVAEGAGADWINTVTNIFVGEFVLLRDTAGHDMTLIDVLLNDKEIDPAIQNTKIKTTLDRMMPEFVKIVTGVRPEISDIL